MEDKLTTLVAEIKKLTQTTEVGAVLALAEDALATAQAENTTSEPVVETPVEVVEPAMPLGVVNEVPAQEVTEVPTTEDVVGTPEAPVEEVKI